MISFAWVLGGALVIDAMLGDPPRWPHLVRSMGNLTTRLEVWLGSRASSPDALRLAGAILVFTVVGGSGLLTAAFLLLAAWIWPPLYILLCLVITFQCVAAGQLWREAKRVAEPLEAGELEEARSRLAMIVGRETAELSPEDVRRAVIETVAENINDGVVAPLFYLALFGPVGGVMYKAVNTLDSMVGYRNQKYEDLGKAAARLDDLAGWIPARLTALLMVLVSPLLGLDGKNAYRVMRRDHGAHKSPNSGWPESAAAGALGVRLGGPNRYHGRLVEKPWINAEGRDSAPVDLRAALQLLWAVTVAMGALATVWCI